MRILVIEPDQSRQRSAIAALKTLPGVTITAVCADLTGAFDEVEHRPPELVLVASHFLQHAEFETMEMLFRMMSVRWVPSVWSAAATARSHGGPKAPPPINLSANPQEIERQLRGRQSRAAPAVPSPSAGLLSTPGGGKTDKIILIGSSTGGVDALLRILGAFPKDCPPTLIVQHTGSTFSAGLARLLDRNIAPTVTEAADGMPVSAGSVLLAPGSEKHLIIEGRHTPRCRLVAQDRVTGHRPSVDVLFRSAVPMAPKITAAILTGMGKDGGDGMLELRKAGANTIGQDKETSVVYGMPRYAAEIGAVRKTLSLSAIGPALLRSTMAATA